jgi:hypothetical protein
MREKKRVREERSSRSGFMSNSASQAREWQEQSTSWRMMRHRTAVALVQMIFLHRCSTMRVSTNSLRSLRHTTPSLSQEPPASPTPGVFFILGSLGSFTRLMSL